MLFKTTLLIKMTQQMKCDRDVIVQLSGLSVLSFLSIPLVFCFVISLALYFITIPSLFHVSFGK